MAIAAKVCESHELVLKDLRFGEAIFGYLYHASITPSNLKISNNEKPYLKDFFSKNAYLKIN